MACLLGFLSIFLTTTSPVPSTAPAQFSLLLSMIKTLLEIHVPVTISPWLFPISAKLPKGVVCTFCLHLPPACHSLTLVPTTFEKQLSPRFAWHSAFLFPVPVFFDLACVPRHLGAP